MVRADWRTAVFTHDACDPSSHNILLYEDGHAVVADFGGRRHFAVFNKIEAALTFLLNVFVKELYVCNSENMLVKPHSLKDATSYFSV